MKLEDDIYEDVYAAAMEQMPGYLGAKEVLGYRQGVMTAARLAAARAPRVTIEALAQEAEQFDKDHEAAGDCATRARLEQSPLFCEIDDDWYSQPIGRQAADWLRSHLPTSEEEGK